MVGDLGLDDGDGGGTGFFSVMQSREAMVGSRLASYVCRGRQLCDCLSEDALVRWRMGNSMGLILDARSTTYFFGPVRASWKMLVPLLPGRMGRAFLLLVQVMMRI